MRGLDQEVQVLLRFGGDPTALDADGNIQLDSDHTLEGGVHPTQPMVRNADTMIRFHAGEDVVLEQALVWLGEEGGR